MEMESAVGSILEGKVTGIVKFGAFVTLPDGKSGLVHISEIANTFVNDVHDFLQEGDVVRVKVLAVDNGRINLSIKKALPPSPRPAFSGGGTRSGTPRPTPAPHPTVPAASVAGSTAITDSTLPPSGDPQFEDKLKQFLSTSKGKMADLSRNIDGKRGGRHRR